MMNDEWGKPRNTRNTRTGLVVDGLDRMGSGWTGCRMSDASTALNIEIAGCTFGFEGDGFADGLDGSPDREVVVGFLPDHVDAGVDLGAEGFFESLPGQIESAIA